MEVDKLQMQCKAHGPSSLHEGESEGKEAVARTRGCTRMNNAEQRAATATAAAAAATAAPR